MRLLLAATLVTLGTGLFGVSAGSAGTLNGLTQDDTAISRSLVEKACYRRVCGYDDYGSYYCHREYYDCGYHYHGYHGY